MFVAYNSEEDLARQEPERLRRAFRSILVIDNGSTDRSVEVATEAGFDVVRIPANPGYAAAVNVGVRLSASEHVVVMNPDVVIDSPAAVSTLLTHFDDPRVGVVAPGLRLPSGALQDSARRIPHPLELVSRRLFGAQHGRIDVDAPATVDWVVGACVCIRRAAFDTVAGFDERYRLYFEDVDLCVRMWASGWSVVYDPTVVVRHEHGAASRSTLFGWPMRQHIRSAARFYRAYPAFAGGIAREPSARHGRLHPRPATSAAGAA